MRQIKLALLLIGIVTMPVDHSHATSPLPMWYEIDALSLRCAVQADSRDGGFTKKYSDQLCDRVQKYIEPFIAGTKLERSLHRTRSIRDFTNERFLSIRVDLVVTDLMASSPGNGRFGYLKFGFRRSYNSPPRTLVIPDDFIAPLIVKDWPLYFESAEFESELTKSLNQLGFEWLTLLYRN